MLMWFSGTGKSTLAEHISKTFNYKRAISADEVHTKLRAICPFIFKEGETNINSWSYKVT